MLNGNCVDDIFQNMAFLVPNLFADTILIIDLMLKIFQNFLKAKHSNSYSGVLKYFLFKLPISILSVIPWYFIQEELYWLKLLKLLTFFIDTTKDINFLINTVSQIC